MDAENVSIKNEENSVQACNIYVPEPIPMRIFNENYSARLLVRQIVYNNYMDGGQRIVLGPFYNGYTAIVGQHGSGLENFSNYMLFVFGDPSNEIQTEKLSSSFAHSENYQDGIMYSVDVHVEIIPPKLDAKKCFNHYPYNPEIVVSRRTFKGNRSEYILNNKQVENNEIVEFFNKYKFNLKHNGYLILQNEIESIATMQPHGNGSLLNYLDSGLKTSRYTEPLNNIITSFKKLNAECCEMYNSFNLAQNNMEDLQVLYFKAIKNVKKHNQLAEIKNIYIQKNMSEVKKKLHVSKKKQADLKFELKEHDQDIECNRVHILKIETFIKNENYKLNELKITQNEIERRIKFVLNKHGNIETNLHSRNLFENSINFQLKFLQNQIKDLEKVPLKNRKDISDLEKVAENITVQKNELEIILKKNMKKVEQVIKPWIKKNDFLEAKLTNFQKYENINRSELAIIVQNLQNLQSAENEEREKLANLQKLFEEFSEKGNENLKNIDAMNLLIVETKNNIEVQTKEFEESDNLEKSMQLKLEELNCRINELREFLLLLPNNEAAMNALMHQKSIGNITGVIGRLGDLGAINGKYELAISTACRFLDNVVVDTTKTALQCLEYLKINKIGAISFISLESVEHLKTVCREAFKAPPDFSRLFDLIGVEDERVLPVFYFALGDVLVTDNFDEAAQIAFHGTTKYRVVTLEGDLMEPDGVMYGGHKASKRPRMAETVVTKAICPGAQEPIGSKLAKANVELKNFENLAQAVQTQITELQKEHACQEMEILRLKGLLEHCENEIPKLMSSKEINFKQRNHYVEELKLQKRRIKSAAADQRQVKELKKQISQKQKELDKAVLTIQNITAEKSKIDKNIAELNSLMIIALQKKVTSNTIKLSFMHGNISKLKIDMDKAQRKIKQIKIDMMHLTNELNRSANKKESLNKKLLKYETELVALTKKLKSVASYTPMTTLAQAVQEATEVEKAQKAKYLFRIGLQERNDNINNKVLAIENRLKNWQLELNKQKLYKIPYDIEDVKILKLYTDNELDEHTLQDLAAQLPGNEEELDEIAPSLIIIDEYNKKHLNYLEQLRILTNITEQRKDMHELYLKLFEQRLNEFMSGFKILQKKLKEIYKIISQGGKVELTLSPSNDPFYGGVQLIVQPPNKICNYMSELCSKDQKLASMALVLAVKCMMPHPVFILDRIDTMFDVIDVSLISRYLQQNCSERSQVIIVSLQPRMFDFCHHLIGIYKRENCSKSITICNHKSEDQMRISKSISLNNVRIENSERRILHFGSMPGFKLTN